MTPSGTYEGECVCGDKVRTTDRTAICRNPKCPQSGKANPVQWPADYEAEPEVKVVEE